MVIGLIIGLRITADHQRPEETGGRRCETIRTGGNDNSREKMQNVRGDSLANVDRDSPPKSPQKPLPYTITVSTRPCGRVLKDGFVDGFPVHERGCDQELQEIRFSV